MPEFIRIDVSGEITKNADDESADIDLAQIVKKAQEIKWNCTDLQDITDFEELCSDRRFKLHNYTLINHRYKGPVIVKCRYEELKKIIQKKEEKRVYGFNKN